MKYIIEVSKAIGEDEEAITAAMVYHQKVESLDLEALIKLINKID